MASFTKRGDGWTVRWRDPDGTNRRRQVPDARTRDRLIREIESTLAAGRRWEPDAGRNPSISEVIDDYMKDNKRVWKPNTHESHDVSLSLFEAWAAGRCRRKHLGIEQLSRTMLGEFWDYCREQRGMNINSANLRARSVEQWWRWAWEHDQYGDAVPRPRKLQLPAREQRAVYAPTWVDMDASIHAHTTRHYSHLCTLLRCTGLRKSQAMNLRWEDIDLEAGEAYIRPELGKTRAERRGRRVPLAPVLVEAMAGWGRREGHVIRWPSELRKPHNITMQRAWERAGVSPSKWKQRTAHSYRKGFVTGLIAAGANREAVEFLVGHSMGLRGVYTNPAALTLRDAVQRVPPMLEVGEFDRSRRGSQSA